ALRDPALSAEAREAFEQIMRGTDRMQAVIEALLAAARGEAGASGGVTDATAAAREAVEGVGATAARGGGGGERVDGGGASARGRGRGNDSAGSRAQSDRGGGAGSGAQSDRGGGAGAAPLRVAAERQLVVQALAPLLDNAVRHARGRVAVWIER